MSFPLIFNIVEGNSERLIVSLEGAAAADALAAYIGGARDEDREANLEYNGIWDGKPSYTLFV